MEIEGRDIGDDWEVAGDLVHHNTRFEPDSSDWGRAQTAVLAGIQHGREVERIKIDAELDALRVELRKARESRDAAIREASHWAQRAGRVEGVLIAVKDRLAYLQGLWGAEALTQGVIDAIEALSREADA